MNNIKDIEHEVADTSRWGLMLYISTKGFRAVFHNRTTSETKEAVTYPWECSESELIHRLQEAVYEHSGIVTDHATTIIIESSHFVIAPSRLIDSEEVAEQLIATIHTIKDEDLWVDNRGDKSIIFTTAPGMDSFLRRTFIVDKVISHLHPLIKQIEKEHHNDEAMMAILRQDRIDIAAVRNGQLLLANTIDYRDINDATYHILNAWQILECDQTRGQLRLIGDRETREKITPTLEKFITYVSPFHAENISRIEGAISLTLKTLNS